MKYPAKFTTDTTGFVVSFRDIPEAITQGDTEAEALAMAQDALITAMDFYFEDRRPVPAPSAAQPGEHPVSVPLSIAAKVMLLNEMLSQRVKAADLARMLGVKPQEISRLIDLNHSTKIDTVVLALAALGKDVELRLV